MDSVLAIAEANIYARMEQLSVSSNNVANANTTGYRSKMLVEPVFERELISASTIKGASVRVHTDLTSGAVLETGRSLDLALSGKGFFQLESPSGYILTRNGRFEIDSDGRIVGVDGWPLKVNGQVEAFTRDIEIAKDGRIFSKGSEIGQIEIVDADPQFLVELDSGLFLPKNSTTVIDEYSQITQSHLESSNVNLLGETTKMMAALRSVESTQKLVRNYDALLDTAISTLGEF